MKKLFAIKHIESEGYLQLEPQAGNWIVNFEDHITTFGDATAAEEFIEGGIYVEGDDFEREVEENEFVIVELTISKETEV